MVSLAKQMQMIAKGREVTFVGRGELRGGNLPIRLELVSNNYIGS